MTHRTNPLALPAPDGDHDPAREPPLANPDTEPPLADSDTEPPPFAAVPHRHPIHNGWTEERQRGFIDALADTGSVLSACRAVGLNTNGAYRLRRQPGAEEFRDAWSAALDAGVQRVEDVAMDRALNGVEQPVYSYGKLIGTRVTHNDRLLMFVLRNRASERFGGGASRAMNAGDRNRMNALKQEWRAEWDAERAANAEAGRQRVLKELAAMAERMDPAYDPLQEQLLRTLGPEGEEPEA